MSSLAIHQLITLAHTRPRTRHGEGTSSRPDIETPPASSRCDDCAVEPRFDSLDEAMQTRETHTDHVPLCRQYLGAIAYLGGLHNDDYE
ncbi:hypothetical protein ABZV91_09095 [Nocardia sp. NPDC004568]|uniref:hypothetical protein n=1 Tax=Nocardia sp. NPDC004568 TaxID=3154551 RepID=UPI0033AF27C8